MTGNATNSTITLPTHKGVKLMTEQITKETIQQEIARLATLLNDPSVTPEQYLKEKEKLDQLLAQFQKQNGF